jgi:hypothetical protein
VVVAKVLLRMRRVSVYKIHPIQPLRKINPLKKNVIMQMALVKEALRDAYGQMKILKIQNQIQQLVKTTNSKKVN